MVGIGKVALVVALLGALAATTPAKAQTKPAGQVRAGVGVVDATWNVGASAGQHASDRPGIPIDDVAESLQNADVPDLDLTPLLTADTDPNLHATKRKPSYGVQSRLSVRAIVVKGTTGPPVALLKSDNYLAQDTLIRRVGELLAARGSRVTADHILYSATHNHSSPYYTTAAAGVWVFQDVVDLRMLEYQARAMAKAIERAEANLTPVRVGATTVAAGGDYRNAPGGAIADDGSPSGYPQYENDNGLVVLRFDDVSGAKPKPLAIWMNYGIHPESLDGYNLISGDYIAPLERFVERDLGAPLVFSQGDVGSSEPATDVKDFIDGGIVRAFAGQGYAQTERHARFLADRVVKGFNEIGSNEGTIPWMTDFPVAMFDGWVPGPVSHPYPSVGNCRTEPTVEGNPGVPGLGLPDCERGAAPRTTTRTSCSSRSRCTASRFPRTTTFRRRTFSKRTTASTFKRCASATSFSRRARASRKSTSSRTSRAAPTRPKATSTTAGTGRPTAISNATKHGAAPTRSSRWRRSSPTAA